MLQVVPNNNNINKFKSIPVVERPTIGAGLRHADPPWRRGSLPVHHIQTDCLPSTVGGHVGYLMKLVQKLGGSQRRVPAQCSYPIRLVWISFHFVPGATLFIRLDLCIPRPAAKVQQNQRVVSWSSLLRVWIGVWTTTMTELPPPAPFGAFLAHRWAFQAPNKAAPRFSTSPRRCKALSLSRPTEAPRKRVNR